MKKARDYTVPINRNNILRASIYFLVLIVTGYVIQYVVDQFRFDNRQDASGVTAVTPVPLSAQFGQKITFYDKSAQALEYYNVPDAAPRAFVDNRGRVHLMLSQDLYNSRFIGDNLYNLAYDSKIILNSDLDSDPKKFNDHEWLSAVYTEDGVRVDGLISHEYHGWEHSGRCPETFDRRDLSCWWSAITHIYSLDSGESFTHLPPPNHVITRYHGEYTPQNNAYIVGSLEPSNIIKKDGYYYSAFVKRMFLGDTAPSQIHCIMRTNNLRDPDSWRLWDGTGFNLTGGTGRSATAEEINCADVSNLNRGSLSFNTYLNAYLSVFCHPRQNKCTMSQSDDLVNWTSVGEFKLPDMVAGTYSNYGGFLQPGDPSRNFEITGRNPLLVYVNKGGNPGDIGWDRDYVGQRVRLSKPGEQNKYELLDLPFSERSGNSTLDASFYAHNATLTGYKEWRNNHPDRAFLFLGTDGIATVQHADTLNFSGNFTISALLRTDTPTGEILSKGMNTPNGYALRFSNNTLSFVSKVNGVENTLTSTLNFGGNQWRQVEVLYTQANRRLSLFIDGVLFSQSTVSFTANQINNTAPIQIATGLQADLDRILITNYPNVACLQAGNCTAAPPPPAPGAGTGTGDPFAGSCNALCTSDTQCFGGLKCLQVPAYSETSSNWSNLSTVGALPGDTGTSRNILAHNGFVLNNSLVQGLWRNATVGGSTAQWGWARTVPVVNGVAQWSGTTFGNPINQSVLPGTGALQGAADYVVGSSLYQNVLRDNVLYQRRMPIVNNAINWTSGGWYTVNTGYFPALQGKQILGYSVAIVDKYKYETLILSDGVYSGFSLATQAPARLELRSTSDVKNPLSFRGIPTAELASPIQAMQEFVFPDRIMQSVDRQIGSRARLISIQSRCRLPDSPIAEQCTQQSLPPAQISIPNSSFESATNQWYASGTSVFRVNTISPEGRDAAIDGNKYLEIKKNQTINSPTSFYSDWIDLGSNPVGKTYAITFSVKETQPGKGTAPFVIPYIQRYPQDGVSAGTYNSIPASQPIQFGSGNWRRITRNITIVQPATSTQTKVRIVIVLPLATYSHSILFDNFELKEI